MPTQRERQPNETESGIPREYSMKVGKVIQKRQLQQRETISVPKHSRVHMAARLSKWIDAPVRGDDPAVRQIHHKPADMLKVMMAELVESTQSDVPGESFAYNAMFLDQEYDHIDPFLLA